MEETTYHSATPVSVVEAALESGFTWTHGRSRGDAAHADLQASEERVLSFRYSVIKRGLDIVGASILSAMICPAAIIIAAAIRLTSKGPILYREKRIGRFGLPFNIFKFRTMHTKAYLAEILGVDFSPEELEALRTHSKNNTDPRVTPIGRVLRAWSLDELPQLLNVLRGEMSLVGPRPVVQSERDQFGSYGDFYDLTLPGISGLWQVSGRSDLSFERRILLDSEYARKWGILLDIAILYRTVSAVLKRRGAY